MQNSGGKKFLRYLRGYLFLERSGSNDHFRRTCSPAHCLRGFPGSLSASPLFTRVSGLPAGKRPIDAGLRPVNSAGQASHPKDADSNSTTLSLKTSVPSCRHCRLAVSRLHIIGASPAAREGRIAGWITAAGGRRPVTTPPQTYDNPATTPALNPA